MRFRDYIYLFVVIFAASVVAFLFFFGNVGEVKKPVTLQDNFNQTAHILTSSGSSGTGVLVDDHGVLTACHVVVQDECNYRNTSFKNVEGITVVVAGKTFKAVVMKIDPYADLAYLSLSSWQSGPLVSDVTPVTIACDPLEYSRDPVFGIGFPMQIEKNVKSGYISAINGSFFGYAMGTNGPPWAHDLYSEYVGDYTRTITYFTMFDITLLPGNSGGGIFNKDGELIGIVSHILKHGEKITPQAGPNSSIAQIPSGYTMATKPQAICKFLGEV